MQTIADIYDSLFVKNFESVKLRVPNDKIFHKKFIFLFKESIKNWKIQI